MLGCAAVLFLLLYPLFLLARQRIHLLVCDFTDILFIIASAEKSTSGPAVPLQIHCRRSRVKISFTDGHFGQKHREMHVVK